MALQEALTKRLGETGISTQFLDPSLASGETRDGVLHADIQATHFEDDSLDFILSSDVLEHIPWVSKALQETYRILKPVGCHIFTAPFYHHRFKNEQRAVMQEGGEPSISGGLGTTVIRCGLKVCSSSRCSPPNSSANWRKWDSKRDCVGCTRPSTESSATTASSLSQGR